MTDTKIAIKNNYEAHVGSDNWETEVCLDPTDRTVSIYAWFGNGQTMASFHGREICIGHLSRANVADMSDLVAFLESDDTQETLALIIDGYSERWDGSNHRGRLTEDAHSLREDLCDRISDRMAELPTYWSADEWFGSADVVADMRRDGAESIEEYAAEQEHLCDPGVLDEDDVVAYLREKLEEAADEAEDDLALANYARMLLGKPIVTTLEYEQETFDLDETITFTDMGVIDDQEIVLINDTQQCWLAHGPSLWAAMERVRELPALTPYDRHFWWYEQLCADVSHEADAVPAFEGQHGKRNWP